MKLGRGTMRRRLSIGSSRMRRRTSLTPNEPGMWRQARGCAAELEERPSLQTKLDWRV
jgi:hypothetical protein